MTKLSLQLALLGTLAIALLSTSPSHARLYKWVDDAGEVHYGDRPPPVNEQLGHEVLNRSGARIGAIDAKRPPSDEELRSAALRDEREKADRKKELELQRIDRLLMTSFPTHEILELTKEDRVEAINDSIAYLNSRKDILFEKRDSNGERIRNFKRKNLRVPDVLDFTARDIERDIKKLDKQIADMEQDRETTVADFARYAERLDELRELRNLN